MSFSSRAQHLEVGLNLGGSNYLGDLAPSIVLKETHLMYGAFARLNMSSSFAFNMAINSMTISASDQNFSYTGSRNLNVYTPITEYTGIIEFNFLKFGVDVLDKKFSPYVFWGLGITQFSPKAIIGGQKVDLRNYQTEGKSYSSSAYSMPFGMGFKWQFHRHFAAEFNVNFRRMFSDYLDDVSTVYQDFATVNTKKGQLAATLMDPSVILYGNPQFSAGKRRGNSDYADWYITSSVSVSYRFYKRSKCRRFY